MKNFGRRVYVALLTGYVFFYYGELLFWATPDRPGMSMAEGILTWLVYSVFAYVFLCVVSIFRVRSLWAVFLAGAFYGWFEEGIVLQTTYGIPETPFPLSLSFTGLAWHALIDVLVGWYLMRRVLAENRRLKILALTGGIGLFYGIWAVFWWTEPPAPMKALFDAGRKDLVFLHFCTYSVISTLLLMLVHWLYQRSGPFVFQPHRMERWLLCLVILLYFLFITVPAAPKALWVMPPLMGITFWALAKNRRIERRPDAIRAFDSPVKPIQYFSLLMIPLVAAAVYFPALAADAALRTNLPIFYLTSLIGVVLWVGSVVMIRKAEAGQGT